VNAEPQRHPEEAAPRVDGVIAPAAAFVECFETLKRVAAGLGLDRADVQDVLQDVYVQASRRGKALPAKAATAWLVRVTVNRALLEHRQRKRFRKAADGIAREHRPQAPAWPDDLAEKAEDLAAARQAMQELDEDLLVVMSLRYFAEMDSGRIGEALGIPPSTVRRRLHDARLTLAKRLIERGFGP
jgi:RNA polymerase sigma-70 factor (ECF subfamily)